MPDEDVAGGQNQNLCEMMQHAKNHQKLKTHINMSGMEVPCSIPTLQTYFPCRCLDPAFLQFGIMTPRGPSYHPFVPGFGLEVLPFRGDSQFGNPAGVKGCCFGFLLF